ncbi:peptidoglycan recognition protein family protein [Eubacterium oxidoreducens]|uniref:N-acetylmuramoyl-L-alanine amidase n=1 Tax=Eubacterium oxidoreducens TaxID=1732 RepID=A0A1G6AVF6_EUBOX|nr:peptidoglycan recognition family protein [Eubacterium oxidoreducens]SDB12334.1 N-acetylmuramoyl-L-alanine amidase [Eubacterium oxidoreducens]
MAKRKIRLSRRKKAVRNRRILYILFAIAMIIIIALVHEIRKQNSESTSVSEKVVQTEPEIDVQLLDVSEYTRPQIALKKVNAIVIHYTANPGTSAQANRDYFNNLATTHTTKASSHFVIGLEGEIIQCIPTSEMAYASNDRNSDTLAIECCIEDESGEFNDETYASCVQLTAWLCGKFSLDPATGVIRHYDVTGKNCPKYYVEHPKAWEQFKQDVADYIEEYGTVIDEDEDE